jgi:diacylglycerol kinase family enzyme
MPVSEAPALERLAEVAALERPAQAKRMLVIVNPYATTMSDRLKHLVVYALQGRYDVTAVDTQRKGHAIELVQAAAAEGYDVVVAFGGDGTVNEAANGLSGTGTPLTCLPGGSNNVFGKMLGIPNDVVDATEHLLALPDHWEPRAVDLGVVNGRAFTFAAGMGLDASVVERVDQHPAMKRRFGAWYFTQKAVATFLRRYVVKPPRLTVEIDGEPELGGVSVFLQNGQPYTYFKSRPVNLTSGAQLDSGDLAGVVLTRANPLDVPTVLIRALSDARIPGHRRVEAFEGAGEVVIRSADGRPVPWQVDGDHVADDDVVRVSVRPGALRIVA